MKKILSLLAIGATFASIAQDAPFYRKETKTTKIHGLELKDDYAWLKDRESDEVKEMLKAENKYVKSKTKAQKGLEKKLFKEIMSREEKMFKSLPFKDGDYWLHAKFEKGSNYPVYYYQYKDTLAEEKVFFNEKEELKKVKAYSMSPMQRSADMKYMAIGIDRTGSFEHDVVFREFTSNVYLKDTLKAVTSLAWMKDNKSVYYTIQHPVTNRSYRLMKHVFGESSSNDQLIYEEKDSLFSVYTGTNADEEFVGFSTQSSDETEFWYKSTSDNDGDFKLFKARENKVYYDVAIKKDYTYVSMSKDGGNSALYKLKTGEDFKTSEEVIPTRLDVEIDDFQVFEDYIALIENHGGVYKLRVVSKDLKTDYFVDFNEEVYTAFLHYNVDRSSTDLICGFGSYISPYQYFKIDMKSGEKVLLKKQKIEGGYNSEDYVSKRIWVDSKGGVKVPVSILHKKGIKLDGSNPLYMRGYGAYGFSEEPDFSSTTINLLDRGVVVAFTHVRGGSDLGNKWYEDGKMLNKKNSFYDFIASAEGLIEAGYTSKGNIIAEGGSAGGLLMGAVVNMRPDLFKSVILQVPFVDVVNTMLDDSLPLTTGEYKEWGNPNEKEYFDYMMSYSPYDNVEAKEYPNMLFTTGIADEQVGFWEPAKMVAKLRELKTDDNEVLFKVTMKGGHGGAAGVMSYYKDLTFKQAYMLNQFGIKE